MFLHVLGEAEIVAQRPHDLEFEMFAHRQAAERRPIQLLGIRQVDDGDDALLRRDLPAVDRC